MVKKFVALIPVLTLALGLVSCGTSKKTSTEHGHGEANSAYSIDEFFVLRMIPHHKQALQLVSLIPKWGTSPRLRRLGNTIFTNQTAELKQMKNWLVEWGITGDSKSGIPQQLPEIIDSSGLKMLKKAKGKKLDRMFYRFLIKQHLGAINMAKAEVADGKRPEVQALAAQIIKTQQAEIFQLRSWLKK